MQVNAHPVLSLPCSVALGEFLRVKRDATNGLALAGAYDREIGTLPHAHIVSGLGASSYAAVLERKAPGTVRMVAAGAITQYATVYGAAGGKIDDAPNGNPIGLAMTAATADGDYVEVLRFPEAAGEVLAVEAHTADDTLTAIESGSVHTSVGATGTITLTLPPATVGLNFKFRVGAAQQLRIDPDGTEKISLPSTGVPGAAGKYLVADADGETVQLACTKAGEWSVLGYTGTWTAEA